MAYYYGGMPAMRYVPLRGEALEKLLRVPASPRVMSGSAERYAVSTAAPMLSIPIIYTKSTGMNRWSTPMRSTSAGVPVISVPEPRLSTFFQVFLTAGCTNPRPDAESFFDYLFAE